MAESILDLILRVKKSGTGTKETENEMRDLGTEVKRVKGDLEKFASAGAAFAAVTAGIAVGIKAVSDSAERLGRTELQGAFTGLKDTGENLIDTMVTLNIGGRDMISWLTDGVTGITNVVNTVAVLSVAFEKSLGLMDQHTAEIIATKLAYQDVVPTAEQLAQAQKDLNDPLDESARLLRNESDAAAIAAQKTAAAAEAAAQAAVAAQALKVAEQDLATIIAGPVSAELDAYYQKQKDAGAAIADTKLKIDELNKQKMLTPEQQAEMDTLNATLKTQQQAYDDNAREHEDATARIVFGFIQQRYAADGLQDGEIAALAAIGKELGIYDQKTADVMTAVDKSITEHGTNGIAIVDDLRTAISDLPDKTVTITYQLNTVGSVPPGATQIGSEGFEGWVQPAGTGGTPPPEDPGPVPGSGGPLGKTSFDAPTTTTAVTYGGLTVAAGAIVIYANDPANGKKIADDVLSELAARGRGLTAAGAKYVRR